MGCLSPAKTANLSVLKIIMISDIQAIPLYKNKDFLYQKYVAERLSCDEIAAQIASVRSTILKHLKLFEIPVRESGSNIRRWNQSYGMRILKRQKTLHKRENECIQKMRELRLSGFSYWKIASILNSMKIPTKTRKGPWQARTVKRILDMNKTTINIIPRLIDGKGETSL